ncbi:hypothetical protein WMY93_030516 [Mugilogobius chulae]|uniref:Uncharacterized protein n=1 Tax=Mugilogobius chulae TaxID=88201 RepID=A0AAW0MHA2_9GOBI
MVYSSLGLTLSQCFDYSNASGHNQLAIHSTVCTGLHGSFGTSKLFGGNKGSRYSQLITEGLDTVTLTAPRSCGGEDRSPAHDTAGETQHTTAAASHSRRKERKKRGRTQQKQKQAARARFALLDTMMRSTDFAAVVLTAALLFDSCWRNNGEHAAHSPCHPGFSQSFFSVLVPKDALQGRAIQKVAELWVGCVFGSCTLDISQSPLARRRAGGDSAV